VFDEIRRLRPMRVTRLTRECVIRRQPQLRRAAAVRQPFAVRTGHDPILAAVQEQDWRALR